MASGSRPAARVRPFPFAPEAALWIAALAGDGARTVAAATVPSPVGQVVARMAPAVVHIATDRLAVERADPELPLDRLHEEFVRAFAGAGAQEPDGTIGLGSGTIVDPRGYVITSEHVVARAGRLVVGLMDRRRVGAVLVGKDPALDLAVLKLEGASGLLAAEVAEASAREVGETLIVIGNPFGLSHSVTVGVLSAKDRSVRAGRRTFAGLLQTDAAINPGNSGGPVLDLDGRLVGIATAVLPSAHGIGFAIDAARARPAWTSLIRHGAVHPVWLGLASVPSSAEMAHALGLPAGVGRVVTRVVPGSPAAEAGIGAGDVIAQVGDRPVGRGEELEPLLARSERDRTVVELVRDGSRRRTSVARMGPDDPRLDRIAEGLLGVVLEPVDSGLALARVEAHGRAAAAGLAAGDLWVDIDGVLVRDRASFRGPFLQALARGGAIAVIRRAGEERRLTLTLD